MDPDEMMIGITREIKTSLKNMRKAKKAEEKLIHSEIVKNLCESLGVFLDVIREMDLYDDAGDDDEGIPF